VLFNGWMNESEITMQNYIFVPAVNQIPVVSHLFLCRTRPGKQRTASHKPCTPDEMPPDCRRFAYDMTPSMPRAYSGDQAADPAPVGCQNCAHGL
jgi:hypothetical protein